MSVQMEFPIDPSSGPTGSKFSKSSRYKRFDRTGARKFTGSTIARVLTEARGNISETARRLGCARDTIRRAIGEHNICHTARDEAEAIEVEYAASHAAEARDAGKAWAIRSFLSSAKAARHGYGPSPKAVTEPRQDRSRSRRRGFGCGHGFREGLGIGRNQVPFKSLVGRDPRIDRGARRTCWSGRLVAPDKALSALRLRFDIDPSVMRIGSKSTTTSNKGRFHIRDIGRSIIVSRGNLSDAARRLGCRRDTIQRAINKYEICRWALEEVECADLDFADEQLHAAADAGEPWAICFILKSARATRHGFAF